MNELYLHLKDAFRLMQKYKDRVGEAKGEWESNKMNNSRLSVAMISFDFASQIKLPVSAMETQGDWMKNTFGLSINIFGITHDGEGRHHHYLYPEGFSHGSANVVSMVDVFFRANPRIANAKKLIVYTDSCGGQNRNNFVLAYFATRICAGYHESISWNFLIVGHTKFSPDRGFALVRNEEKKNTILTMKNWIDVICKIGEQEEGEFCTAEEMLEFRQWKALSLPFKKFDGIQKLDVEEIVFTKGRSNSCNVSYKQVSQEEFKTIDIKRTKIGKDLRDLGFSEVPDWPTDQALKEENLPEKIPLIPLSFNRWNELCKNMKQLVQSFNPEQQVEVLKYWENLPHLEQGGTEVLGQVVEGSRSFRRTELDRTAMQASAHAMASRVEEQLSSSSVLSRFEREVQRVTGPRKKRRKVVE